MSSSFALDTLYTLGHHNELSPIYLNYICVLNGHYPVPIEDSFNYCELGCGQGITTNGLAELFPQGQFIGIDINTAHIDAAVEMAEEIGTVNIEFKALDFNDLPAADLPKYDFIVLHRVYSWIDRATKESIRKFISAHLNEDGVVYVSYDALPGWAAISPLRDMMLTHTAGMMTDDLVKAQSGLDYLDFMSNNNAAYFVDNPPAKNFLEEIKTKDIGYVAHELLVDFSKPSYFHQVATEMQSAELNFSGSAILHLNFIDLAVPPEFREILAKVTKRGEFESRGDFIRNQCFRRDVFKKSNQTMDESEQLEALSQTVFGMTCAVSEFKIVASFGDVELNYVGDVFSSIIDVLSNSAKTAVSLIEMAPLKAYPLELIIDALKFLTAGGQVVPMKADAEGRPELDLKAERYAFTADFNIQLLKRRLLKQDEMVLIAPPAGIGIEMSMADALFALCMVEASRDEVADWVFQRLVEAKREGVFMGGTEKEAIALAVEKFREIRLPKFLELGILEPAKNA